MAFRKVDLLGIDNALRGGHVRYTGSSFRFGLHGGIVNPQNVDPIDLSIIGADKQAVGQLAAVIRSKRPPTPYGDNKGVRSKGETIRKKAGKAFGEKK